MSRASPSSRASAGSRTGTGGLTATLGASTLGGPLGPGGGTKRLLIQLDDAALLQLCAEIITSYNPLQMTPDTHCDNFFVKHKLTPPKQSATQAQAAAIAATTAAATNNNNPDYDAINNTLLNDAPVDPYVNETTFIRQVFYGVERCEELIKVTLDSLYHERSGQTNRTDYTLYQIITYLALIRLNDMGFDEFRHLILSQDPVPMHVFLKFLWDDNNLDGILHDIWCTVYDHVHVEQKLIGGMRAFGSEMDELLHFLEEQVTGKVKQEKQQVIVGGTQSRSGSVVSGALINTPSPFLEKPGSAGSHGTSDTFGATAAKKFTVPEPFNLTQPQPRLIPEPTVAIPRKYISQPVPETIYGTSLDDIEKDKVKRREATKEKVLQKYENDKQQRFELHSDKRPSHSERVRAELNAEREKEYNVKVKANPVPNHAPAPPVKLTTAAILREDALYKKKQEQEAAIIRQYEVDLRDSSEYYKWQEEMKGKDEAEKAAEIERRRGEMAKSAQIAATAVADKIAENKVIAQHFKDEAAVIKVRKEQAETEVKEANRAKVVQVQSTRENIPVALAQVTEENKRIATDVQRQKDEHKAAVAVEREAELVLKRELIRQIQAMEREANVKAKRPKEFDPTVSSGHGLLDEMSIVELRERVAHVQAREAEQLRERRKHIVQQKVDKHKTVLMKAKNISRIRSIAGDHAAERRIATKTEAETVNVAGQAILEKNTLIVHDKILEKKNSKRHEALKLAAEIKAIKVERQFLNADKAMVEEKKWKELQKGSERAIVKKQTAAKEQAEIFEKTKAVERHIKLQNQHAVHKQKQAFRSAYNVRVDELQTAAKAAEEAELVLKLAQAATIRQYETEGKELARSRNPYATKMADKSLARGKTFSQSLNPNTTNLTPSNTTTAATTVNGADSPTNRTSTKAPRSSLTNSSPLKTTSSNTTKLSSSTSTTNPGLVRTDSGKLLPPILVSPQESTEQNSQSQSVGLSTGAGAAS